MSSFLAASNYFGFFLSIAAYFIGYLINKKIKHPLANPMLIAVALIIVTLSLLKIDYETYNKSAQYLSYFVTPALVCLAIPVYQQFQILKNNAAAILVGAAAGMLACFLTVLGFALLFKFTRAQYATFLPKSVTTAIGMAISGENGGYASITAAVIAITGLLGNLTAVPLCRLFRITDPLAKGLAIGSSSHVLGTARALEIGELEGAVCSVAIVVCGLIAVICVPVFISFHPLP